MHRGTVKWFNDTKGFGFLTSPQTGETDIFVHYKSIDGPRGERKTLIEGQEVDFEYEETAKGLKATVVVPA